MNQVRWVTCYKANCGSSPYPSSALFDDRCKETHEIFFCPQGHSQKYHAENRYQRLEATIVRLENDRLYWMGRHGLAERTCPWVGCGMIVNAKRGLNQHLRSIHGMPTLAEVATEQEAV